MENPTASEHFIFARRTGMIAHRGVHTEAPENTLLAMELAAERGFEMVEMDVQLTADGEYVIIHDATVDRTTLGTGRVDGLTLSQLQRLVVKGADTGPEADVVRVPTMEEAFATCGRLGLGVNVDCSKIAWNEKVITDVVKALKRHGLWARSFFVNGHRSSRHLMARMYPDVAVTWLSSDTDPRANIDEVRRFRHAFVTYSHRHLTDELFRTYSEERIPVFVYQCNDVEVVRRWRDRGARFIETDTVMPSEV